MADTELETYQHELHANLKKLAPIFAKATLGDFSKDVEIPASDNELSVFFVGVQIMLDAIREKESESQAAVTRLNAVNIELQHEKAGYHAIISSMAEGLVVVDKDARITIMNEMAADLLGLDRRAVVGCNYYDIVITRDRDNQVLPVKQRPLYLAIHEGKKQIQTLTDGFQYVHSSGTTFPVVIAASPVKIGKQIIGGVSTFRDITEEAQLDRTKSEIISIASHQLRTPLTAIKWITEQLATSGPKMDQTKQRQYIHNIQASNERMIALVNDLLNVSRIELGTLSLNTKPFDLPRVIDEILKDLTSQITLKHITFKKNLGPELHAVVTDPWHMQVILQNLLANAVKYSLDEHEVIISAEKQGTNLYIAVQDSGYGIPAVQQKKIFTKLFRADNARKAVSDGSGLGLYVCKAMVQQLGGKIWFESVENKGSTFYVTIPWLDPVV